MVVAVILAAGAGRRMGGHPKALLTIDGQTFLERVIGTCRGAGLDRIVAVTREDRPEIAALARASGARTVNNADPERGMFSSVRLGIEATFGARMFGASAKAGDAGRSASAGDASSSTNAGDAGSSASAGDALTPAPPSDGVLIFPVDHPRVAPETVSALIGALSDHPADTWLRPVFEGRGGHPILVNAADASRLLARAPGETLRDALGGLGLAPHDVPVDDPGILANLNRPGDLNS